MSDYLPTHGPETCISYTVTLSASVTGGQLITWAGAPAGAASTTVAGVAGQDGNPGDKITVWGTGHHKLTTSGTVTQGDPVCAGAAGVLRTWVDGTDPVASYLGRAKAAASGGVAVLASLHSV